MRFLKSISLLLITFLTFSSVAESNITPLSVGDNLSLPQLKDQFDKPHALSNNTRWLVFSHDMDSSKIARVAFDKQTSATLAAASIQYYADISAMPSLISRFIAIPKMKKLNYTIIMDKDGNALNRMPKKESKISIIELNQGKIEKITLTDDIKVLKKQLLSN